MTIPIAKSYEDSDGNLYVEGLATDDMLDLDEQIIDKEFARRELPKWFSDWGNVRQMHATNLPPAGKAVECIEVPEGHWVKTLVVEPAAKELVKAGVYQAYSVGISKPRIIRDSMAKGGRVVDGVFSEISLVDFPANPRCKFEIAKRAGATDPIEIIEKVSEPALTKATPADLAKGLVAAGLATGAVTVDDVAKRAAAEWYTLVKRDMDPNVGGGVDRDKLPASDFAGPNRSFPIVTPGDVEDAAHLIGHADDPEAVKERIIEIAHRKGKGFVDALPDSWKKDDAAEKAAEPDVTKGKPDPDCKTCHGSGKIRDGHVDCPDCMQKAEEPEVAKGRRDCPNCGQKHHADFKGEDCPGCGHKLPTLEKAAPYHREPDETVECPHCHKYNSPDAKFCDQCGHKLTGEVKKNADAEPRLAEHPEPDGDEDGPDLDRDEGGKGVATPVRTKALPYHLARLHDATCAAYRAEDVLAVHPAVAKGIPGLVDVQGFADAVSAALTEDAGSGSRMADLPALSEGYGLAVSLKAADPELAEQAMAEVRKAFSDMFPDAHPKPTDIEPGQFKRPYLSAGRAPMTAGKSPRVPLDAHTPTAASFDRSALTAGQERLAPGSKAGEADLTKGQSFFSNAAKGQAQATLTAMHDYIADSHPGLCPMHGHAEVEKHAPEVSEEPVETVQKAGTLTPDVVKQLVEEAVAAATGPLNDELATLRKSLDEIASQPDPDAKAYRGSAVLQKVAGATQTPAGRGDEADTEAVQEIVRLVKRAKHPDTEVSTPAMSALMQRFSPKALADLLA